jgi:hypothetical protein
MCISCIDFHFFSTIGHGKHWKHNRETRVNLDPKSYCQDHLSSYIRKWQNTNCKLERNVLVEIYKLNMRKRLEYGILLSTCWKCIMAKLKSFLFVIKSGKKLTIGVNCEINVKKCGRGSCFCCFKFIGVIYQRNSVSKVWIIN